MKMATPEQAQSFVDVHIWACWTCCICLNLISLVLATATPQLPLLFWLTGGAAIFMQLLIRSRNLAGLVSGSGDGIYQSGNKSGSRKSLLGGREDRQGNNSRTSVNINNSRIISVGDLEAGPATTKRNSASAVMNAPLTGTSAKIAPSSGADQALTKDLNALVKVRVGSVDTLPECRVNENIEEVKAPERSRSVSTVSSNGMVSKPGLIREVADSDVLGESQDVVSDLATEVKAAVSKKRTGWNMFSGKELSVATEREHTVAAPVASTTKEPSKKDNLKSVVAKATLTRKYQNVLKALQQKNLVETPLMRAIRVLKEIEKSVSEVADNPLHTAAKELVGILEDFDSLNSISKGIRNNSVIGEITKNYLKVFADRDQDATEITANDRWKKLKLLNKKTGLKALLENNRRVMCKIVTLDFSLGKPVEGYELQPRTSKWRKEQMTKPIRDLKRLGTQELMVSNNDAVPDRIRVEVFSHPAMGPDAMAELSAYLASTDWLSWGFSVLELEARSGGQALWAVGMAGLCYHDCVANLNLEPRRVSAFLLECQRSYCFDPDPARRNIYHNSTHGADVALTVLQFLENQKIGEVVNGLQAFALVLGAVCHDYRHPGLNNGYLVKVSDPMAVTYNDVSVLENFHAAEATRLMARAEFNLLANLEPDVAKSFRSYFIKVILATDLAHAFQYIAKFNTFLEKDKKEPGSGFSKDNSESQLLLMQFAIKCADICHPSRPWDIHCQWTHLISEEFFAQGAREKEEGLPISFLCDRATVVLPKSQCDFINFLVKPCLGPFSEFAEETEWMDHLNLNYERWELEQKQAEAEATAEEGKRSRAATELRDWERRKSSMAQVHHERKTSVVQSTQKAVLSARRDSRAAGAGAAAGARPVGRRGSGLAERLAAATLQEAANKRAGIVALERVPSEGNLEGEGGGGAGAHAGAVAGTGKSAGGEDPNRVRDFSASAMTFEDSLLSQPSPPPTAKTKKAGSPNNFLRGLSPRNATPRKTSPINTNPTIVSPTQHRGKRSSTEEGSNGEQPRRRGSILDRLRKKMNGDKNNECEFNALPDTALQDDKQQD